jgi:hypothetical protein
MSRVKDIARDPANSAVVAHGCEEVPAVLSRLLEAREVILIDVHDGAQKSGDMGDDGTNNLTVSEIIRTNELQGMVRRRASCEHTAGTRPLTEVPQRISSRGRVSPSLVQSAAIRVLRAGRCVDKASPPRRKSLFRSAVPGRARRDDADAARK